MIQSLPLTNSSDQSIESLEMDPQLLQDVMLFAMVAVAFFLGTFPCVRFMVSKDKNDWDREEIHFYRQHKYHLASSSESRSAYDSTAASSNKSTSTRTTTCPTYSSVDVATQTV